MIRKFLVLLMCLTLCWTAIACSSSSSTQSQPQAQQNAPASLSKPLSDGEYPVQQATYNDADGSYGLFLLNTPSGTPPVYNTVDLQMAQLSEEDIEAGKKTYLKVENGEQAMYMKDDFRFEYVHNVTETTTDPQTGQSQTIVVRRESSFWAPFAGVIAGQAVSNLLFRPQYYVPPVYQPGGVLTGYGGYGNSYNSAVQSYQSRYQQPPAAVKNRQTLRTTSNLRNTNSTTRKNSKGGNRATGSGVGSSNLNRSRQSTQKTKKQRSTGFGSGKSRPRARRRR